MAENSYILFVEDDERLRHHLAESLSDEFTVDTAPDGEAALLAVLKRRPDLIVTDLIMPGLDGVELVRTLRNTPSTSTIPILMVSGRSQEDLRLEGFELGADSYLHKPYTERELRVRIRSMLRTTRLRSEIAQREARVRAEELATAERAALLDSITSPFCALDREWRFTYVNTRALQYWAKRREDLLGRRLWDEIPSALDVRDQLESAVRNQASISFEFLSSFSQRWMDVHAYPTPSGLAVNFRDISLRKQAQEQQRRSEERFRAFVSNSSEAIWLYEFDVPLDLNTRSEDQLLHLFEHARLAELNEAMARMYGYERADDLTGARLSKLLSSHDPQAHAYLMKIIEARFEFTDIESTERDRHGQLRYFSSSMIPIVENDRLLRAWGTRRDITDRKLAEEALKASERRKDEFLAVLAHELRNPLAPIRSGLEILRRCAMEDARAEQTLGMMNRQMDHMVRLVDDLLDMSRISRGKLELRQSVVALPEVLSNAVESVSGLIEARGHRLSVEVRTPEVLVYGDPDRLAQVFANLLSNAAKYTDREGRISVMLDVDGSRAFVRVSDTGIGIAAAEIGQVFDLFTQVNAHSDHVNGGLGIGLSLVRSLVDMHGGAVTAHSEGPGQGSTFTIELPTFTAERAEGTFRARAPTPLSTPPHLRILIVDDNQDAAVSLSMVLSLSGHDLETVFSGRDAVAAAGTFQPDVIFMDVGMPDIDGLEATRQIRSMDGKRPVIVALTGWGQEHDRKRTREAGFDEHLVKPVSADVLEGMLAKLSPQRSSL
jgi:PAS domain S-box-containing protein